MDRITALRNFSFAVFMLSASAAPALGSGFALNSQSAEALGAATAGAQAAQATPGNAFFNPAAIVGIEGGETSISAITVINDTSYENAEGVLFGVVPVAGQADGEAVIGDAVIPTGAAAVKVNDLLFAGVAAYAPFGFNSSYDDASVVRYQGTFSQVVSGALGPIVGVALGGNWSIAGGPRLQYLDIDLNGAIDAAGIESAFFMTSSVPGTDDIFFEFQADDWGLGYSLGVQGNLTERIRIGVSFLSKVEHDLNGAAVFDIGASVAGQNLLTNAGLFQDAQLATNLTTPATVQIGAIVDVSARMRLMASAVQTRWSSFERLTLSFDNPSQPPEITTQNWDHAWSGSVGAEHDLSSTATLRAGVMAEQDPVNPNFSTARVPGAKRLWLTAGYSKDLSDYATLHLSAAYIATDTRPINQDGTLPENLFRGALQAQTDISGLVFGLGLDWRF